MENLNLLVKDGVVYADSREVAEMVDKRHADLCRDIAKYIDTISTNAKLRSLDFFIESSYIDKKGESRKCYLLTKKGCDMVANKMTGEKGVLFTATYIDKFYEMEKQLKEKLPDFTNPVEAARAWADECEAKMKLLAKNKELENTVTILTHTKKTYTMTEIAKELNMRSARQLNEMLYKHHIQFKQNGTWLFYSEYSDLGYEHIKQEINDNTGRVLYHRKITQRGREFIIKKVKNWIHAK